MNNEIVIQITSGRGPAECCWVVARILKKLVLEAQLKGLLAEIVDCTPGMEPETLSSAMVSLTGESAGAFASDWLGTILWVGKSQFRPYHKRKNWYVGIDLVSQGTAELWNENDIVYQTLRSSGPGGQHVNKTESAVRAIHRPTGIQVLASDNRSQMMNRKLATVRLQQKLNNWRENNLKSNEKLQWNQHNQLERGNPVKIFKGMDFADGK